jgi:hypothetical protein
VAQGQEVIVSFYWQWARATTNAAIVRVFLDDDWNPLNANARLLGQFVAPATSGAAVSSATATVLLAASNAPPGRHTLFAAITGGDRTRYLYAPEPIEVLPSTQPPTLDIAPVGSGGVLIGINGVAGQIQILQGSTNALDWYPVITNPPTLGRWVYTNESPAAAVQFYRALLKP